MPDETDDYAIRVADSLESCRPVVPPHWGLEVVSAIVTAVRRRRFSADEAIELLEDFALIRIRAEIVGFQAPDRIAQIAINCRLSAYDAAYLLLARERNLPLATFDSAMLTRAKELGVARFEPE